MTTAEALKANAQQQAQLRNEYASITDPAQRAASMQQLVDLAGEAAELENQLATEQQQHADQQQQAELDASRASAVAVVERVSSSVQAIWNDIYAQPNQLQQAEASLAAARHTAKEHGLDFPEPTRPDRIAEQQWLNQFRTDISPDDLPPAA